MERVETIEHLGKWKSFDKDFVSDMNFSLTVPEGKRI